MACRRCPRCRLHWPLKACYYRCPICEVVTTRTGIAPMNEVAAVRIEAHLKYLLVCLARDIRVYERGEQTAEERGVIAAREIIQWIGEREREFGPMEGDAA